MPLPNDVLAIIADTVKQRRSNDVQSIVGEVIETLAGKDPDQLLRAIRSAESPTDFIRLIQAEVRRLKSITVKE